MDSFLENVVRVKPKAHRSRDKDDSGLRAWGICRSMQCGVAGRCAQTRATVQGLLSIAVMGAMISYESLRHGKADEADSAAYNGDGMAACVGLDLAS